MTKSYLNKYLVMETLANKLINATKKEENQIIVNNIKENEEKVYKKKMKRVLLI